MVTLTDQDVLTIWFGSPTSPTYGHPRPEWFAHNPEFDQILLDQGFASLYEEAAQGNLQAWENTPLSCLALTIVLDQFPRNLFRNTPQAFATDPQARQVAHHAITQGFDAAVLPVQRWFFYLPFEHSETLADQEFNLKLWDTLQSDPNSQDAIEFAKRHWQVIQQFGRFPHRNEILGRPSTPAELEFLEQPGSRF